MRSNIVIGLVLFAGFASSPELRGQSPTFDFQLVFDNDPRLAAMGVNYGANVALPGPDSSAVGLTLIGRVTTQGTQPNFGLREFTMAYQFPTTNSIFYHNDTFSNQTSAAWTSPALAMSRGRINDSVSNAAPRGLMSYTQPANYAGAGELAQAVSFRANVSGLNPNRNSARLNAVLTPETNENQPLSAPFTQNNSNLSERANTNGWVGVNRFGDFDGPDLPATVGNTFPNEPGSAVILAVGASRFGTPAPLDSNGNVIPTLVNFGGQQTFDRDGNPLAVVGADQDATAPGVQSIWYAVYRMVFTPRPAETGPNGRVLGGFREVTVTATGGATAGESVVLTSGDPTWILNRLHYPTGEFVTASVTFQVPSPTALALMTPALLLVSRRRR